MRAWSLTGVLYGPPVLREGTWSVHYTSRDLPEPAKPRWYLGIRPSEWESWLDELGIPDGTPFLLSPRFGYDELLNSYFLRVDFLGGPVTSQANRAQALARFLNFLHVSRGGKGWREATEGDHLAFHHWRRRDPRGPIVDGDTWSQEVAHQQQFYVHAVAKGWVGKVPIPQRPRREWTGGGGGRARAVAEQTVPATYAHDAGGERIEWLPAASYRRWRDVGVLGHGPDGMPRGNFRGRWASRNATFCDLLIRTGMRISEQSHVLDSEMPTGSGPSGYSRFWLPAPIAKRRSARWVYVPASVRHDLTAYAIEDRRLLIADAQAEGRYRRIRRPIVIADPGDPRGARHTGGLLTGRRVDTRLLGPAERRRLLVETDAGLEPAMFWLGEGGMPLAVSTWQDMFADANARCRGAGVDLHAHAHLLRHSFSVITLEQLQRGHIAALGEMNPAQRLHYQRIFGDPLDWVRRRLGHRSQMSTLIYLHALQELELETRMALVPDTWEDPRATEAAVLGEDVPPADLGELADA